jgi:tRNA-intron lyase
MSSSAPIIHVLQSEGSCSCVVTSPEQARKLWEEGYFGASTRSTRYKAEFIPQTPTGDDVRTSTRKRKRRSQEQLVKKTSETVQLSSIEAKFLNETRNVPIHDTRGAPPLTLNTTLASTYHGARLSLDERYTSYKRLRLAGFVPKTGTQYGAEYVLYEGDPSVHHSKYCVVVEKEEDPTPIRMVLAHMRVAEQTRKLLVMTSADKGEGIVLKRWVCKHEIASSSSAAHQPTKPRKSGK